MSGVVPAGGGAGGGGPGEYSVWVGGRRVTQVGVEGDGGGWVGWGGVPMYQVLEAVA